MKEKKKSIKNLNNRNSLDYLLTQIHMKLDSGLIWAKRQDALLRILETRLRTFHVTKEYIIHKVLKGNFSFRESKNYMKIWEGRDKKYYDFNFCKWFDG